MKVLVCGGRDYNDRETVFGLLEKLRPIIDCIICGGAPGADMLAYKWARNIGVPVHVVMADWDTHGKAAGPIRNQRMIDEHQPELVLAFPGGRGTADMTKRALEFGALTLSVSGRAVPHIGARHE